MSIKYKEAYKASKRNDLKIVEWLKANGRKDSRMASNDEDINGIDMWSASKEQSIVVPIDTKYSRTTYPKDLGKDISKIWYEAAIEVKPGSGKFKPIFKKAEKLIYCFQSAYLCSNGAFARSTKQWQWCYVVDARWLEKQVGDSTKWKDAPSNRKCNERSCKKKLIYFSIVDAMRQKAAHQVDFSSIGLE